VVEASDTKRSYLGLFPDCLINDVVVLDNLLLHGIGQILQTGLLLLQVDVAETSIEQNLTRVKLEEQTKLRIVDHSIASQVQ
jgi:hypothetical protein